MPAHKIGSAKTGRKCFIKLWNLIGDLYLFWAFALIFPRLRQALSVIRKPENVWISTWGNKKNSHNSFKKQEIPIQIKICIDICISFS